MVLLCNIAYSSKVTYHGSNMPMSSNLPTATTIGCAVGVISVYNSLYTTLDKPSRIVVANLFHCKDQLFKVRVVCTKKQSGGTDCGVFSIAFATSIAINHKVDTKVDQARMRTRLVSCLEKKKLSLFPSK